MRPIVTLLTDFGTADGYVAEMKGVLLARAPGTQLVDVTHDIPPQDVESGRLAVARYWRRFAPGTVHVAVVDPGVGSARAALAVESDGRWLVGPDNGLLLPAAARFGGVAEAVDIGTSPWRLDPVAATFHGRDIFAPVAARLALGEPLGDAGPPLEPGDLVPLERTRARVERDGSLLARVVSVDTFGNVQLDAAHDQLAQTGLRMGRPVRIELGGRAVGAHFAQAFADVGRGELLVYEDASRMLAIAVNTGDAADDLLLAPGDEVRVVPG